jgi:hypothetical protein
LAKAEILRFLDTIKISAKNESDEINRDLLLDVAKNSLLTKVSSKIAL